MKIDPQRLDFQCANLAMLIGYAFRISPDRVAGPDWTTGVGSPRFNIVAAIPPEASRNQVPEMLQALLAERFKLVTHRAAATLPVYALVVAKSGLRIKKAPSQSNAGSPPADTDSGTAPGGFYGAVQSRVIPAAANVESVTMLSNARMGTVRETGDPYRVQRWEAPNISFAGLADLLDNVAPLSLPVIDATGLPGRYQLVLEVSLSDLSPARRRASAASGAPAAGEDPGADMQDTVLAAFNKGLLKLGLRLERRTGPVERVIVDHVERTPTEN